MNYNEIDQEFTQLVKRVFDSGMEVEVLFEALAIMQSHPQASPKLALQIGLNEWDT